MLINKSRLATYAKHAKVTHTIYNIASCHDYKVVNIIQESSQQPSISSHVYIWCSENKSHPYPRVLWRFKSIITLQGKITWQHDTREPQRQHEWPPFVMTIKESGRILPHPSAVFHAKTSPGSPWVTQTLSLLSSVKRGKVLFNSMTVEATKFVGFHIAHMHQYIINACCRGSNRSGP
jgi:hypothetical protein